MAFKVIFINVMFNVDFLSYDFLAIKYPRVLRNAACPLAYLALANRELLFEQRYSMGISQGSPMSTELGSNRQFMLLR